MFGYLYAFDLRKALQISWLLAVYLDLFVFKAAKYQTVPIETISKFYQEFAGVKILFMLTIMITPNFL